jgi:hypothetical protein
MFLSNSSCTSILVCVCVLKLRNSSVHFNRLHICKLQSDGIPFPEPCTPEHIYAVQTTRVYTCSSSWLSVMHLGHDSNSYEMNNMPMAMRRQSTSREFHMLLHCIHYLFLNNIFYFLTVITTRDVAVPSDIVLTHTHPRVQHPLGAGKAVPEISILSHS